MPNNETDKLHYLHGAEKGGDRREALIDGAILDPQEVLHNAVNTIMRSSDAEQIFTEWPNLHRMSMKLVNYLSPIMPGASGGPLIEDCLRSAIDNYMASERRGDEEREKIGNFVAGIMFPAPAIFDTLLYAQYEDKRWRAWEYFSQPVVEWLGKHASSRILVVRADKDSPRPDDCVARAFLCANVATPSDFRITGNIMDQVCACCERDKGTPKASRRCRPTDRANAWDKLDRRGFPERS